ncbi:MAG: hypothetical protein LBU53_01780 [Zoogloeaceae bacterium]|jgi:NADH pyrophosphatase NudC (nudix superfamily)|nr:hypothetical protein [Zoogloeaceae bacterium]
MELLEIADASGELVAQASEIGDLGWFDVDRLPALPHPASLACRMILHVLARGRETEDG